jgi:hypothetical protein
MRLAKNDDMIQALAADRPDQPFGKAILPGRGWCGRLVPDAHGAQSTCDDRAIDLIPIAKEIFWGIIPFPPYSIVQGYFYGWSRDGRFTSINYICW